jgi:hypothetical protein
LRNQRPALRVFGLGLAVLGLCVFAWGLKYKLSLYDPPRAISHHMPAAKLLTGNERRALPVVDPLHTTVSFGTLGFLGALFFAAVLHRQTRTTPEFLLSSPLVVQRRPAPAWAPGAAKFIRPPPRFR